jgi:hypothetical protein
LKKNNKIRIITYYYTNNYGALLQGFLLREYLREKFPKFDVNFYDYLPKKLIYHEFYKPLITIKPSKFIYNFNKFYKLNKWKKKNKIPPPKKKLLNSDINIFGSDEIWNFDNKYFGFDPKYFGSINQNAIKISYAPSIGMAKIDNIDKYKIDVIKKNLSEFKNISVRDYGTYEFIKSILNKKVPIVLDPVLLEKKIYLQDKISQTNNSIALVYGFTFSNEEIKKIKLFTKEKKLKIYSIGFFNKWADINLLNIDIDDFIFFFNTSKIIFTSMFHGVMLSYKFNKNFWFTYNEIRKNKLEYFINFLELNNRKISLEKDFDEELDYNKNFYKFEKWQKTSQNYILNSIESYL